MNANGASQYAQPAVLPELEQLLVRTARRRQQPRLGRRRWALAAVAAALALAGGAAAATGVLQIDHGSTSEGAFSVETRPVPSTEAGEPQPTICLQLTYEDRGAAFGCGYAPSVKRPFGLLVSDPLAEGSREGVVYGLVASDIATVSVLGLDGEHHDKTTEEKEGLPGRFFAVVVPRLSRVEVVGYDKAGKERARIGSLAPTGKPPLSHAEAVQQGDPAGFAPTAPTPNLYTYEGRRITEAEATRLGLACMQGRDAFTCYRSPEEAEAARRARRDGN